ncbi:MULTISPECIES: ABC transporter ATP-binding protein [Rhodomicrobium]|uniref:ABC transporter ATP-binding protein n=1 Tax=Rhodomicrobium TaxID=1068 RepID=UPI000B4B787C|nr:MULTISPECIES: ABC transporter ATP-binding protein [Rhodomicrobium]
MTQLDAAKHIERGPALSTAPGARSGGTALKLTGINKSFPQRDGGRLEVLRDIDLSVRSGAIQALLGRSGSGKSTLLNIVSGLTPADTGTVTVDGKDFTGGTVLPMVGYVFQDDRLMPWRTARANIAFALENQPLDSNERAEEVSEMLTLVGLDGFGAAYPNELSGGMRSRVALARSLVRRPKLLLMDEPFSRLDEETRTAMHEEIIRLRDLLGMTILFVTHDVEEAAVLADEVTVLAPRPGRIAETVDIAAALPQHPPLRDGTDPAVVEIIRQLKCTIARVSAQSDARS